MEANDPFYQFFTTMVKDFNIEFDGIWHVGAHQCEETNMYEQYLPREKILWIEALPEPVEECRATYPSIRVVQAVVSDREGETVLFHRSSSSMSSSLLPLGEAHKRLHPNIHHTEQMKMQTTTLAALIADTNRSHHIPYTFLNLDTQGNELKVLQGLGTHLYDVKYIYTEIAREEIYEGGVLLPDLDAYLTSYGFVRLTGFWATEAWGDALYVQKALVNHSTAVEKIPTSTSTSTSTVPASEEEVVTQPVKTVSGMGTTPTPTTPSTTPLSSIPTISSLHTSTWTWPSLSLSSSISFSLLDKGYQLFGSTHRGVNSSADTNSSGSMTEMDMVAVMIGSAVLLLHMCGWIYITLRLSKRRNHDKEE